MLTIKTIKSGQRYNVKGGSEEARQTALKRLQATSGVWRANLREDDDVIVVELTQGGADHVRETVASVMRVVREVNEGRLVASR